MRISQCFATEKPVFSFEFFPPKTDEALAGLYRTLGELAELKPSFVSVTYGAGGSTRDLTVELVSRIKGEIGLEPMAHLTCVGHGRAEIAATLDRLQEASIENVLALRGDPPRGAARFERPADGFGYAYELVEFVRANYGFCLGAAAYPERHPESTDSEADLRNLKNKVDRGVDFLLTQLFFDPQAYFDFVARARALDITQPIVPGIMPITNAGQVERFTSMCGATIPPELKAKLDAVRDDDTAVVELGIEWATNQCRTLLRGGAPGVHFYTLNRSHSTQRVFQNLQR
ncbi:MAG TPA: methylenetetrahydrofolate reductase [NAD(P)H] [Armatimonadota bacterium]|jgi:methylenetetrahydrofolate reductase (NADPH)